jgi:transposase-like protein
MKLKTYTPEFRAEAVKLVLTGNGRRRPEAEIRLVDRYARSMPLAAARYSKSGRSPSR